MIKRVFFISFLAALLLQGLYLYELDMADTGMWAHQAEYVQTGNPAQFDPLAAYGHPGGPIIEGVIVLHQVGLSYDQAMMVFLTLLDAVIIAGICTLCFLLSRDNYWWPVTIFTLSLNRLYEYSTPPSTIASLLLVFITLLTLYLCKKEGEPTRHELALWAMVSGLAISTRADIGSILVLALLFILKDKINWRQVAGILLGVFAVFCITDPFMWYMPLQHLGDLASKIIFHYSEFAPTKLGFWRVLNISSLPIISVGLWLFLVLNKKIKSSLSLKLFYTLLALTAFLYCIFLTANFQTPRYFLPVILIWETLLPLAIFSIIPHENGDKNKLKILIGILLIIYSLGFFAESLWINHLYNLLP